MFINQADLPRIAELLSPGRGQSESIERLSSPVAGDAIVLKTYKPNATPSRAQAEQLLQAGAQLEQEHPSAFARIAWPRAFVTSRRGGIAGALLPMAPKEVFYEDRGQRHPCPVELLCLPDSRPVRQSGLIKPDIRQRLSFCLGAAAITSRIHEVGGLYCDISQSNILWTCDPNQDTVCMPYFLDADGIIISSHRKDIHTANWKDEYPRPDGRADAATDVYKVALLTFRVLNLTFRLPPPGQYRLDTSLMPMRVASALQPLLSAGLGPRQARPTMQQLHAGLRDARDVCDALMPAQPKATRGTLSAVSSRPRPYATSPRQPAPTTPRAAPPASRPQVQPAPATVSVSSKLREQMHKLRQWLDVLAPPAVQGAGATLLAILLLVAIVSLT